MIEDWIWAPWTDIAMVVVSAVCIYVGVIAATRLTGLRSFARFSSFDFAMSIAIGSLISTSLLTRDPPLAQAIVGLAAIYGLQKIVALLRQHTSMATLVDNTPTVLIEEGKIIEQNLRRTAITEHDLRSLLRVRNVTHLDDVHAVILETTGDVSVVHSRQREVEIDPWLLEDVRGGSRFEDG